MPGGAEGWPATSGSTPTDFAPRPLPRARSIGVRQFIELRVAPEDSLEIYVTAKQ